MHHMMQCRKCAVMLVGLSSHFQMHEAYSSDSWRCGLCSSLPCSWCPDAVHTVPLAAACATYKPAHQPRSHYLQCCWLTEHMCLMTMRYEGSCTQEGQKSVRLCIAHVQASTWHVRISVLSACCVPACNVHHNDQLRYARKSLRHLLKQWHGDDLWICCVLFTSRASLFEHDLARMRDATQRKPCTVRCKGELCIPGGHMLKMIDTVIHVSSLSHLKSMYPIIGRTS